MNKIMSLLTLGLAAAGFSQTAAAQSVTLDPGFYHYASNINFGGLEMPADADTYCVKTGENSLTFDELADGLAGDGQCEITDVNQTPTTANANFTCTGTPLGIDLEGTLEAKYGSDFYEINSRAQLGVLGEVLVKTTVRRIGECPVE